METRNKVSIAVDGPSGAGKSTLAKVIADKLGFVYVDTGAIYRCVGLFACRRGVEPTDQKAVTALLEQISIEIQYDESGVQRMYLNGGDVTKEIRIHEISHYASCVSAIPEVRAYLLQMQRDFSKRYDVIMDGRDIGTVVLPDANLKIFLTATAEDRAERRYRELLERGQKAMPEKVLQDIIQRDKQDMSRAEAPLRPAEDAVMLDTTGYSLEESIHTMLKLIKERLGL